MENIYVSFSEYNRIWVEGVVEDLLARRINLVDFSFEGLFSRKLEERIERIKQKVVSPISKCSRLVVFWGSKSEQDTWVHTEIEIALSFEKKIFAITVPGDVVWQSKWLNEKEIPIYHLSLGIEEELLVYTGLLKIPLKKASPMPSVSPLISNQFVEAVGVAKMAIKKAIEIKILTDKTTSDIKSHHTTPKVSHQSFLPAGIFMSYRRDDAFQEVEVIRSGIIDSILLDIKNGLIKPESIVNIKKLKGNYREIVEDLIFLDTKMIEEGSFFPIIIDRYLLKSIVLVLFIGPNWSISGDIGRSSMRNLRAEGGDWVAKELESAIRHDVAILPILVGKATMPTSQKLPKEFRMLSGIEAITFDGSHEATKLVTNTIVETYKRKLASLQKEFSQRILNFSELEGATSIEFEFGSYLGQFIEITSLDGNKQKVPNGYGTLYIDGAIYMGIWNNGLFINGIMEYFDGDKFEGEHRNNRRHGLGIYYFYDGRRFIGEYINGINHGLALSFLDEGMVFAGDYFNGERYTGILCQNGIIKEIWYHGRSFTPHSPYPAPNIPAL